MKWTLEMEEEYIDLNIIREILKDKRTVGGELDEGIYIKENYVPFKKISVLDNQLQIFLPEQIEETQHYGKEFIHPKEMGMYEEYSMKNGLLHFIVENATNIGKAHNDFEMEDWKEKTADDIEERYEDTVITELDDWNSDGIEVSSLMAEGLIGEELDRYIGYIYLLLYKEHIYRIYIMSEYEFWEIDNRLGRKIADSVQIKEEQ